ncbi:MAG: hypothetical protein HOG03_07075 [Desulfobacula sp.]|jgi:hypothetical protein|uniref:hypothetical protein n=1 Tax=Desulfobacula sp. TaxID=2593537 RepID=UPI001D406E10|nr:hypothetical protein [Desulfobacula sp.]MBT3484718.1 hypothetical protein [Desulfobacula sp.]MBT3804348.1 hypothetical protein [Desulfobacula sp.]MBT4025139.1 hypothetical protein [Desulfobacula sp.]MBT4198541.1 hypothetical protein [Desulfobacula sp.]
MKQYQITIYEKCFIGITGTAWATGLLIAGSDSPYMPWLNGMGLILFLGASILLGKLFKRSHSNTQGMIYPGCYRKFNSKLARPKKKNRKINTPYAMGI